MKKITTVLFIAFFVFASDAFAQLSYGGGIGATFALNDNFTKPIGDGGLGVGTTFHYGAKLRFGIPLTPISLTASGYWAKFKSEGQIGSLSVSYEQNFFVFSGGAEFTFMPGPIKPFIAADFLYTRWDDADLEISGGGIGDLGEDFGDSFEDVSRTGLAIGAGAKLTVLPLVDLELVAKYNMHNLFGKEEGEDDFNTYTITFNVLF